MFYKYHFIISTRAISTSAISKNNAFSCYLQIFHSFIGHLRCFVANLLVLIFLGIFCICAILIAFSISGPTFTSTAIEVSTLGNWGTLAAEVTVFTSKHRYKTFVWPAGPEAQVNFTRKFEEGISEKDTLFELFYASAVRFCTSSWRRLISQFIINYNQL